MALSEKRLLLLAGGGGALALSLLATCLFVFRACGDAPPTSALAVARPGAAVASEGMNARGTAELRAIGCDPAIVIDMKRLLGDAAALRDGEPRYVVTCDVPGAPAPTCERAAGVYFAALSTMADGYVNIRVARPGAALPVCTALYAPSGALVR